jgi:Family of unknown function (DUF6064)
LRRCEPGRTPGAIAMTEWWTYRLSDFLMFSPAIYWRMVERMNRELWPLPLAMLALGMGLVWLAASRRPWAGKAVAGALAGVWLWVGWAFHWQRYAQINWAAEHLAAAFALQGALLLGAAWVGKAADAAPGNARSRGIGLALAACGVLAWPFMAVAEGRPMAQAGLFGLMPEPTALATLGLLMATHLKPAPWLAAIPVLSLLVGLATWWVLQA